MFDFFINRLRDERKKTIEDLISSSFPRSDFFVLVSLSIMMATLGLLMNNMSVVIGSMLIAPLLYPILTLALGAVTSNILLISTSFRTLVQSTILGVVIAMALTWSIIVVQGRIELSLVQSLKPSYMYGLVAVTAGFAASFAVARPGNHRFESFPGIAISVALIPPLAAIGIGIAHYDLTIVRDALILYGINVSGILWASLIVFISSHISGENKITERAIAKEEQIISDNKI